MEHFMESSKKPSEQLFEIERKRFLPLLLANPNYFGNLADSPFKPVKKIIANSSYEELKCVGFNPQLNQLEGVVLIKQTAGYDGGICTSGSLEYVSFYLSYDNGATWLPQGTTSFQVFDMPGAHPLEYAVSVVIQPYRKFCFINNLPLVRAILSWNTPPVGPTSTPVWGNVLDARIQIPGFFLEVHFPDLLKAAEVSLPPAVSGIVSDSATVKLQAPKALSVAELKEQYANANVPAHRFLHGALQKAISNPANLSISSSYFTALGIDLSAVIGALENTNGNTDYEQLGCIGLDGGAGSLDALVGTLVIKLPTGYLGNPCAAGSKEYVAFWIDWGKGWQYEGTASVNVYDIAAIPKGGLNYAVYQPVNLNPHRKPCGEGPVTAKVRAILSWETPPPPSNPNYVPVWGNRLETVIFINPGASHVTGNFTPYFTDICGVAPCDIDQTSGWAHPGAGDNPFGASIAIYGIIPGQPLFVDPPAGLPVYQVTVQQYDTVSKLPIPGTLQILTDPFPINILKQVGGGLPTSTSQNQVASGGYFTWQQMTPSAAGWNSVSLQGLGGGQGPLAVWNSVVEGTYLISVTAWDAAKTTSYPAGSFICTSDGSTRQNVVIDLDQKPPVPDLKITGYKPGGVGPCIAAVNCQTFTVGDVICGTYSISDAHIGGFSLQAEPTPSPTSGFTVDGSPGNGESYPSIPVTLTTKAGAWTYDTTGLPPCGYTIQLFTGDRTIVDCYINWEDNSRFVGFCLVAAKP
jgi:hypothetical protein